MADIGRKNSNRFSWKWFRETISVYLSQTRRATRLCMLIHPNNCRLLTFANKISRLAIVKRQAEGDIECEVETPTPIG